MTTSLTERVIAQLRTTLLGCVDFGTYDFAWLEDPTAWAWQLAWLQEAASEARADGYPDDADAYEGLHSLIAHELGQLA